MALRVKDDMLSSGITPNVVTWSSLISACANSGLVEQAFQLFEEMRQAGCEPNSQCFNTLLHACVEAHQYDRAFRIFQSWKEKTIQQTSSSSLKLGHQHNDASSNEPSSISKSGHSAKRISFMPTTTTYNIIMKACGTDYQHAKALMDEMKTVGLSPNYVSWSILIDICGGTGDVKGAIQVG